MNRLELYKQLIAQLEKTYETKNHDYGNSVGDTYKKFGDVSFLVRITDKFNRINTLYQKDAAKVAESMDDTILDMANYCLLWLIERQISQTLSELKGETGNAPDEKHTAKPISKTPYQEPPKEWATKGTELNPLDVLHILQNL